MVDGHGPSIGDGRPLESALVTYTWVIYKTPGGRRLRGQVVGPDQDYAPSPDEVFVSFPSTGFVRLLPVSQLEPAEETLVMTGEDRALIECGEEKTA